MERYILIPYSEAEEFENKKDVILFLILFLEDKMLDYITGDITDVKWGSMFADLRKYVENGDD